jgi:chromosome segregation ATPase
MSDVNVSALGRGVDLLRSIVTDWDGLTQQLDGLTREHGEAHARLTALEQQHRDLQESHERQRQERDEGERALADLRVKHATLVDQHDELVRSHRELAERCDRILGDRDAAAGELEGLLRRLRP